MPVRIAGDEIGAARGAACFRVVVGEQHALGGDLVEIWRPPGHHAAMIGADIPDADVVAHDDDDVRPLPGGCWRWLRLCGTRQSDRRERGSRDQRTAAQQQVAAFQSCARWRCGLRLFRFLIVIHDAILFW
jgi:hypothetical protein